MSYQIITIPPDAREDTEQLGSKPKFWVLLDGKRWLFKEARLDTGEDWAEKLAAELAKTVGIRSATVELAEFAGRRGCISLNFVDVKAGQALVHGNEVLAMRVTGYDKGKVFRQSDHTLENIDASIRGLFPPPFADSALTELAGFMVLDALIGNTDRHHENWGLLLQVQMDPKAITLQVAPSFDHASSLGRELRDERRQELLNAKRVKSYITKGRGGIFRNAEDRHGANPLHFVEIAARAYPEYFQPALSKVSKLTAKDVAILVEAIPEERISITAKQFATAMILDAQAALNEIPR